MGRWDGKCPQPGVIGVAGRVGAQCVNNRFFRFGAQALRRVRARPGTMANGKNYGIYTFYGLLTARHGAAAKEDSAHRLRTSVVAGYFFVLRTCESGVDAALCHRSP